MGQCAYCGKHIDLEELKSGNSEYDIDHIFPRSKTKDDSISRNLVLVHRQHNKDKNNNYPINPEWQNKMRDKWSAWYKNGLITKDKYDRLIRTTPLAPEEYGKYISSFMIEDAQHAKSLRNSIARKYPNIKIIIVKADRMPEFYKHLTTNLKKSTEFYEISNLHNAKNAYLNIVVGNVLHQTFTDNPCEWLKAHPAHLSYYSITPKDIWCCKPSTNNTYLKGWDYSNSIDIISEILLLEQ